MAMQRPCPICNRADARPLHANRMAVLDGLDMSYSVGTCPGCGFYFAHELPEPSVYGTYYRAVSKYDLGVSVSGVDQERFRAAVAICEAHFPRDALVVDIGCGHGAFLHALAEAGWSRLAGVDPAPQSPARARELFGLAGVRCATMAQAHEAAPLAQADVVCIMAVLEHLPALRQDVQALLRHLRPGCRLLVEVPAVEWFLSDRAEPFGEFSLEHIQFFTARSLCNFFAQLGARPLYVGTLELPAIHGGTLFGVFEWTGLAQPLEPVVADEAGLLEAYVEKARAVMQQALEKIPACPVLVYGAGSHTARLLPLLQDRPAGEVLAVLDKNPNLVGKPMDRWTIEDPAAIARYPGVPIVISSYRAQAAIARQLAVRHPGNPLVRLYPESA